MATLLLTGFALHARAEDGAGKWAVISESVTAQVKPGWPGKTAGIGVDPASRDVYLVIPDQGMWKSSNQGQNFKRVDGKAIGGRCETGSALNFDPAGKRLMCFMIYGSSAKTNDAGETWLPSKTSHLDFGAVDWADDGQCLLAIRHESGGMLTLSTDEGQTWKDLGKGFTHVGLFNDKILLGSKGQGLVRSEDGGSSWSPVSDINPTGSVMHTYKDAGYWCTDKGLLVSRDQGKTWAIQGAAVHAVLGPYWGENADTLVVAGKDGLQKTTDGGKSWKLAAPLPSGYGVGPVGPNYAWDAKRNIFYASSMGKDALKYVAQ